VKYGTIFKRVSPGKFGVSMHLKFSTQLHGATLWVTVTLKSGVQPSLNVLALKRAATNKLKFLFPMGHFSNVKKEENLLANFVLTEHGSVLKNSDPHTHTHTHTHTHESSRTF
jgi:hypothetical protein